MSGFSVGTRAEVFSAGKGADVVYVGKVSFHSVFGTLSVVCGNRLEDQLVSQMRDPSAGGGLVGTFADMFGALEGELQHCEQ